MGKALGTDSAQRPAARRGLPRRESRHVYQWMMLLALGCCLSGLAGPAWGQAPVPDLTEMDMEGLLNIEVTSAAKREEPLFRAPAAIYVLTQTDIQRSGATSLPDLLRLVPGVEVAQLDTRGWAISARGFAERYSNKLLVLMDGRTVYDPLFSGVYWDAQNVMLEDIERIEVIRGPGATLWGANAVNGVINIITRSSAGTQGGLLSTSVGSREPVNSSLRYGGRLGASASYRLYANYFRRDHSVDAGGNSNQDDWQAGVGGFRADWQPSSANSYTLEGELLGRVGGESLVLPLLTPPFQQISNSRQQHRGGHLFGRWNHTLSRGGDWSLQAYYDRVFRGTQALDERLDTVDVDFQHHFTLQSRQDWIWGLGYRFIREDLKGSFLITIPSETIHRFNTFLQNKITLIPNRLELIPGAKFEHDPHAGWNSQPSVRLLWTPGRRQAVWAAVSRALRTPSEFETDSRVNSQVFPGPPGQINLVSVFGNEDVQSEKLLAYEMGYRFSPARAFSVDFAAFYNVYDDLQTVEPSQPFFEASPAPPHVVIAQRFANLLHGETYGAEVTATWNVVSRWSLTAAYSRLEIQLHRDPTSRSTNAEVAEHTSPDHQIQVRTHLELPRNFDFDAGIKHVTELSAIAVPGYTRLDGSLGWQAGEAARLSVGGQNLLSPRHAEFGNFRQVGLIGQAERNIYVKLTCRF